VGEDNLQQLARILQVDRRIGRLAIDLLGEQVKKPVLALEWLSVESQRESCVQESVSPEKRLDVLFLELVIGKYLRVGRKAHQSPGFFTSGRLYLVVGNQLPAGELRLPGLLFAERLDEKAGGQRIDGFEADAVQAHAALECLGVVFAAGIGLAGAIHEAP